MIHDRLALPCSINGSDEQIKTHDVTTYVDYVFINTETTCFYDV